MAEEPYGKDPLDRLFVKSDEINKALLSELLIKYVRIDEKGNIFTLAPFYSETNKNKAIIALLAKKALSLKVGSEEEISPKELSRIIDMPDGSLRPTLRALVDERIAEEKDSKYKIFSHALDRCAEIINKAVVPTAIAEKKAERKNSSKKPSMRETINELIDEGFLDAPKEAREILALVQQKRPGTLYQALYKVILDFVQQKRLDRHLRGSIWVYKKAGT